MGLSLKGVFKAVVVGAITAGVANPSCRSLYHWILCGRS